MKRAWMQRDAPNGEDCNKQWLMDDSELDLLSNKKPAEEAVNTEPVLGLSNMNVSSRGGSSSFQLSGQFTSPLFGPEPLQTVNPVERNLLSSKSGTVNTGINDFEDLHGNGHLLGLSVYHAFEDTPPSLNFGGNRKELVNQIRNSDNAMPIHMRPSYGRIDHNISSMGINYNKSHENTISLGTRNNNMYKDTISRGCVFSKTDDTFVSDGDNSNKEVRTFKLMGHNYKVSENGIFPIEEPLETGVGNIIEKPHEKSDGIGSSYYMRHENLITVAPAHTRSYDHYISMYPSFSKRKDAVTSTDTILTKVDSNIVSVSSTSDKEKSVVQSVVSKSNKNGNEIVHGCLGDETEILHSWISNHDLQASNQNAVELLQLLGQKDSTGTDALSAENGNQEDTSTAGTAILNNEPKDPVDAAPNKFPANARYLLSTGIFDGIRVKYFSWCRKKSIKGTIKGNGYLCGCKECTYSKCVSAYEFESHAGCKTKHPNSHIYFQSGKSVYSVVQELQNTPHDMLFDAIQNVTGSAINQKNFQTWKVSYQAACRELQRIYGKDSNRS